MKNAVCKFCGSVSMNTFPDDTPEDVLLFEGTKDCQCSEARKFQERLDHAAEAKLELENICESSEDDKLKQISTAVVNILAGAIDLMPGGELHKISVGTSSGTIDIKISSSGKISIQRSLNIKRKREIGS